VLATVLSLCLAACGTTATITRTDGALTEGRISGASFDEVWLVDRKGYEHRVPRKQILDIAHPGAVAMGVGAAFVALGLLRLYENAPHCGEASEGACLQIYVPAAIGVGMTAWGGAVYSGSVHRAEQGLLKAPDQPPPPVRPPSLFSSSPPARSLLGPPPPAPPIPVPRPPTAGAPATAPAPLPAAPAPPPAPTTPLPAVPQRADDEDS